jgi:hypothetical protein
MRPEADTPIEQRYLWFEGRVSPASMKFIKAGLPAKRNWPSNTEVVFVGFAYANLPFTKQFEVVFPRDRPQDGVRCECKIIAATQQIAKPLQWIPQGWKTICLVQFADDIPQLVQELPTVDGWYQNSDRVCICDEATWQHLKKAV